MDKTHWLEKRMGGMFNYCFSLVQALPISHYFLLFCIFSVCCNKHQRLLYQKSIKMFLKSHLREGFPALRSLHRALKCINGPFVEPKRWTRYQEFTFSLDCSVWLNCRKRRNKDFSNENSPKRTWEELKPLDETRCKPESKHHSKEANSSRGRPAGSLGRPPKWWPVLRDTWCSQTWISNSFSIHSLSTGKES